MYFCGSDSYFCFTRSVMLKVYIYLVKICFGILEW